MATNSSKDLQSDQDSDSDLPMLEEDASDSDTAEGDLCPEEEEKQNSSRCFKTAEMSKKRSTWLSDSRKA